MLTDMNLIITKAYISCDAGWFMDGTDSNSTARILIEFRAFDYFSSLFLIVVSVFNVIDYDGNKIRDKEVIDYIQRVGTII